MKKIQTKRVLRQHNQKVVLSVLRTLHTTTISEIAGRVHLSTNTVTTIIEHYKKLGLVYNTGKGKSSYEGGKRPNLFSFNPKAKFAIGMQITYEGQICAALVDINGSIDAKI